jgi:hypothetical protein
MAGSIGSLHVSEWTFGLTAMLTLAAGELFDLPSLRESNAILPSFLPGLFSRRQGRQSIGYSTIIRHFTSRGLLTLRFLPKSPRTTTVELCIYTKQTKEASAELQYLDAKKDLQMVIRQLENKQTRLLCGEIGFSSGKSIFCGPVR